MIQIFIDFTIRAQFFVPTPIFLFFNKTYGLYYVGFCRFIPIEWFFEILIKINTIPSRHHYTLSFQICKIATYTHDHFSKCSCYASKLNNSSDFFNQIRKPRKIIVWYRNSYKWNFMITRRIYVLIDVNLLY